MEVVVGAITVVRIGRRGPPRAAAADPVEETLGADKEIADPDGTAVRPPAIALDPVHLHPPVPVCTEEARVAPLDGDEADFAGKARCCDLRWCIVEQPGPCHSRLVRERGARHLIGAHSIATVDQTHHADNRETRDRGDARGPAVPATVHGPSVQCPVYCLLAFFRSFLPFIPLRGGAAFCSWCACCWAPRSCSAAASRCSGVGVSAGG